jgi:hypothetical protein
METEHFCPTCKFYRQKPKDTSGSSKTGFCHRYPRQYSGGYYNIIQVEKTDWCGEWMANDEYLKNSKEI